MVQKKKGDETHFLFSAEVTVESVFTVTQWTIWFETLQASEKSEENEMLQKTHKYTTTYSSLKSGLCGAPFVSYFPKVSYNLVELCKDAPCLMCTNMLWDVHQYGNRKSTKTSGFHFFDKNDLFSLWAKLLSHKCIFTAWNAESQNIVFSKRGWKLIQRFISRSPSTW